MVALKWINILQALNSINNKLDVCAYYRKSANSNIQLMDLVIIGNNLVAVPEGFENNRIQYRITDNVQMFDFIAEQISYVDNIASISIVTGKEWITSFKVYDVEVDDYQVILDLGY